VEQRLLPHEFRIVAMADVQAMQAIDPWSCSAGAIGATGLPTDHPRGARVSVRDRRRFDHHRRCRVPALKNAELTAVIR
jgi:hypothetical protein